MQMTTTLRELDTSNQVPTSSSGCDEREAIYFLYNGKWKGQIRYLQLAKSSFLKKKGKAEPLMCFLLFHKYNIITIYTFVHMCAYMNLAGYFSPLELQISTSMK